MVTALYTINRNGGLQASDVRETSASEFEAQAQGLDKQNFLAGHPTFQDSEAIGFRE